MVARGREQGEGEVGEGAQKAKRKKLINKMNTCCNMYTHRKEGRTEGRKGGREKGKEEEKD